MAMSRAEIVSGILFFGLMAMSLLAMYIHTDWLNKYRKLDREWYERYSALVKELEAVDKFTELPETKD